MGNPNRWENEIPIKITTMKRREKKFSPRETMSIGIFSIFWVFLTLMEIRMASDFGTLKHTLLAITLFIIQTVIILRLFLKFYFDEQQLYEQYLKNKDTPLFEIKDVWDIIYIEDNGLIVMKDNNYGGISKALLIKMERGSVIGRPDDSEIQHYKAVTQFLRVMLARGYRIRKYNISVNDTNEEVFDLSADKRGNLTNTKLRDSINSIIKYNKDSVRNVQNRTIEYYRFEVTSRNNRIMSDAKEAMALLGTSIYKPTICDKDEITKFLYGYYKLKYINIKQMIQDNLPKEPCIKVVSSTDKKTNVGMFDVVDSKTEDIISRYKKMREEIDNVT